MGIPLGNSPFDRTENALILAEVKSPVSREIWRSVALAVFRRILVEYATTDRTEIIIFTHPKMVFRLPTGSEVCLFLCIFQMSRAGMHISKEQVWEVLRFMLDSK